jgi:uncharacterized protein involved in response to NO
MNCASDRVPPAAASLGEFSWRWLLQAPHRLFFFIGTTLLVFSLAWWMWDVVARYLPIAFPAAGSVLAPWSTDVPTGWLHAVALTYAALPAYVFGFALTAMPRWLNRPGVPASSAAAAAFLHFTGGIVLLVVHAATGLAMLLASWTLMLHVVVTRVYRGPHPDKRHAALLTGSLFIGWLGLAAGFIGVAASIPALLRVAILAGLWGMLLPVNLIVAHRMLPFFTANVFPALMPWRPFAPLYVLLAASALYGVAAEMRLHSLAALTAGLAAVITGLFTWKWYARGLFSNRLLVMLHIAHAWLPVAFALCTAQQIGEALGYHLLGLAPLHALTIGFLLSTAVAMVSRVTLGHSGRHVSADRLTWVLFWMLQVLTALRVAADIVPWPANLPHAYVWVAIGVAAVCCTWAARYLPIYLRPRPDGLPG